MTWVKFLGLVAAGTLWAASAEPVRAQEARIGGLADVNFGTIPGIADQSKSQNVVVCSYRNKPQGLGYSVIASGTGSGGAFILSAGAGTLPYDVQWADSASQTGGRMLQAGVPASGFSNAANGFDCLAQPDSASLTVTIRAADLAAAQSGTYTGSLQLTIVPE
jgi:hypothetical protein